MWAANLGAIELHTLPVTRFEPERPLCVVFDLDPGPPAGLVECCRAALRLRGELLERGMETFAKASGSRGLHVVAPTPGASFEDTRALARSLARTMAEREPGAMTDRPAPAARRGRVLIDWAQNGHRRSLVAPYSLRAATIPTASVPLTWAEIEAAAETGDPDGLWFGPRRTLERLRRVGDPFDPVAAPPRP